MDKTPSFHPQPVLRLLLKKEEFARQLQCEMKIPLPGTDDWGDLFWHLSHQVQKDKVVLVLDEIRWIQHLHICSNLIAKMDYNS